MKTKVLLTVVVAASMLLACTEGNSYRIVGKVESSDTAYSDTVFLLKTVDGQKQRTDTTLLDNGAFVFKGEIEDKEECGIEFFSKERQAYLKREFVLERGRISFEEKAGEWKVYGTAANDAYTAFREGLAVLRAESEELNGGGFSTEELTLKKAGWIKRYESFLLEGLEANLDSPAIITIVRNLQVELLFLSEDSLLKAEVLLQSIPERYNALVVAYVRSNVENKVKTAVGKVFTDFEMKDPEGNAVKLSDYAGKGKVVFVDFWASWCAPCRVAIPEVKEIYEKYRDRGFEIVGVSFDGEEMSWKSAIQEEGLEWPQMSDLMGWNSVAASIYGIALIPQTMLLDAQGVIVGKNLKGKDLENKIEEIL